MPKHVKYYGIWCGQWNGWVFRNNVVKNSLAITPDRFVVNNSIGVWLNKKKLERNECFQNWFEKFQWEIREFTGLDALKERMKTCLRK